VSQQWYGGINAQQVAPVGSDRVSPRHVIWATGILAVLLLGLLYANIVAIRTANDSISIAQQSLQVAKKQLLSPQSRSDLQSTLDASNKVLATLGTDFDHNVFHSPTTDTAPKQQIVELEYLFTLQTLIAQQNRAMMQAALDTTPAAP
jgi:hypothetical protein